MREIIKATLNGWMAQIDRQDQHDVSEEDTYLPCNYLDGVARFLREVSYELDDLELLGMSTKLEMYLSRRENQFAESEAERATAVTRRVFLEYEISKICRACFKEPTFRVDMSKYVKAINRASSHLDAAKTQTLMAYVDENKMLDKVRREVTSYLVKEYSVREDLPSLADVQNAFQEELKNIYRKADRHVSKFVDTPSV